MDVCTKTLCLKYSLKPNNFPGQRGQGGAACGRLPFLGLLVSGWCSHCNSVAHLEAALTEKLYFVHVTNVPAYKTQIGAVRFFFSSLFFKVSFEMYLCSTCMAFIWLSFILYMWFSVYTYIRMYVWFRASNAEVHSCVASLRKSIKYYLIHVNLIFNTISKVNC